jgi:hypothetical protein
MHCETYCITIFFLGQIQSNYQIHSTQLQSSFTSPTAWVYSSKTSKALCHGSAMAQQLGMTPRDVGIIATDAEKQVT